MFSCTRRRDNALLTLFFSRIAWSREAALPVPVGTAEDDGGFAAGVTLAAVEDVALRSILTCEGISCRPKQNKLRTVTEVSYKLRNTCSRRSESNNILLYRHFSDDLNACSKSMWTLNNLFEVV